MCGLELNVYGWLEVAAQGRRDPGGILPHSGAVVASSNDGTFFDPAPFAAVISPLGDVVADFLPVGGVAVQVFGLDGHRGDFRSIRWMGQLVLGRVDRCFGGGWGLGG